MLDEQDLLRRAMAVYFRQPPDGIGMRAQPGDESGVEEHGGKAYVVLRNVNGLLAVYRVRNDGMLKGMKRWPAALAEVAGIPD